MTKLEEEDDEDKHKEGTSPQRRKVTDIKSDYNYKKVNEFEEVKRQLKDQRRKY
jgi:hypothetical protein